MVMSKNAFVWILLRFSAMKLFGGVFLSSGLNCRESSTLGRG